MWPDDYSTANDEASDQQFATSPRVWSRFLHSQGSVNVKVMTASSRKRAKSRYPEGALQEAGMQRPQRPGAISVWTRTLHSIPATSVKLVANRKVHPYCGDAGRVPGKVSEGSRSVSKAFLSHHEVPTRILTPRPRMMSCGLGGLGMGYRLLMLGPPALVRGSERVTLKSRKGQALLWYLATHPTVIFPREHLHDLLWDGLPADAARHAFNTMLSRLRAELPFDCFHSFPGQWGGIPKPESPPM